MSCPSRHSAGTGKHYTMLENKTDSLRWKYPYTFTERVPLQYESIEGRDSLHLYSPQCLMTLSMFFVNVPFGCSQLGTKKLPVPRTGHWALRLKVISKPNSSLRNPDSYLWACLHPRAIQSNNQGSLTSEEHGARCPPLVEEASWTEVSVQEVLLWQVWHTESWHLWMSHGACEWVMHICMSHGTCEQVHHDSFGCNLHDDEHALATPYQARMAHINQYAMPRQCALQIKQTHAPRAEASKKHLQLWPYMHAHKSTGEFPQQ